MATEKNTIETKVTLDATDAQQEIVKLNAVAADSTKTLEERVAAKNKQLEIQEKLNKKTIADLEKQVNSLKGVVGKEKELETAMKKLNATRVKTLKQETSLIKSSNQLSAKLIDQKNAMKQIDGATNGVITRFTTLAANPIILALTAIVSVMKLLKEAFTSSEEGQNAWNKALLILNTLLGNLLDLVADLADALFEMLKDPQQAIEDFGNFIKDNIETRLKGLLNFIPSIGEAIELVFKGKFKEAGKVALDAVGKVSLGVDSVTDSINKAGEALDDFIGKQKEEAELAAKVADDRAKADKIERDLIVQRSIDEEKIANLRLKAKQEEKFSAAERKQFLNEALEIGDSLLKKELEVLELRRDAQILENTFSRSNKENLTKEVEGIAAVNRKLTERQNLARQIETEKKRVNGQLAREAREAEKAEEAKRKAEEKVRLDAEAAREKLEQEEKDRKAREAEEERQRKKEEAERDRDAQNEIDALEIERKKEIGEETLQLELELLDRKRQQELENTELTEKEKLLIQKKYLNEKEKLEEAEQEAKEATREAVTESAIQGAADAFGISQEVAIARMLIEAPAAISGSFKEAAKAYQPPLSLIMGALGAAGTVAPIIKGLRTIKAQRFPGSNKGRRGGGGGSVASATSTGAPSIPANITGIGSTNITDLSANNAANLGANINLNNSASAAASANVLGSSGNTVNFLEGQYSDFQNQVNFSESQTTID